MASERAKPVMRVNASFTSRMVPPTSAMMMPSRVLLKTPAVSRIFSSAWWRSVMSRAIRMNRWAGPRAASTGATDNSNQRSPCCQRRRAKLRPLGSPGWPPDQSPADRPGPRRWVPHRQTAAPETPLGALPADRCGASGIGKCVLRGRLRTTGRAAHPVWPAACRWCACSWRSMRQVRASNISAVTATNNQPLNVLIQRMDSHPAPPRSPPGPGRSSALERGIQQRDAQGDTPGTHDDGGAGCGHGAIHITTHGRWE